MMSNTQSIEAAPDLVASSAAKPERMLDGFPWVSAVVLYTLSWGWSLLRPNTLYADDWSLYFGKSVGNARKVYIQSGRPLWEGLIEMALLRVGTWAICLTTYILFFVAGVFLFCILKTFSTISYLNLRFITFVFLSAPVNHARIALIIFDYTSAYFVFFLGWFLLVRYRSIMSFVFSWMFLFFSLKTHSLLFFVLLPFSHFVWLRKSEIFGATKLFRSKFEAFLIAMMPFVYLILRHIFWPPSSEWESYQQPTSAGLMTGLWPVLVGLLGLSVIGFRYIKNKNTHFGVVMLVVGFSITALALFPYFLAELYVGYAGRPAYITVFEFRADWRSRHQLLMPLGLALSVVGLNELLNWKKKNLFLSMVIVVSVGLNMFWGSQYFLQSHKQEQLVELFKSTKSKLVVASVSDSTLRFNGRENIFRGYEWDGFMTLAGIATDRPGCEALPNGSVLVLKSDKPYLSALISRDLGLYFDVTPCTQLLAKDS